MHMLFQKHPPYFGISSVLLQLLDLKVCFYFRAQSNLLFVPILVKMHKNCLPSKIKVQDQVSRNAHCLVMPLLILSNHSLNQLPSTSVPRFSGLPPVLLEPPARSLVTVTPPAYLLHIALVSLIGEIRICFYFIFFGFS